MFTWNKWNGLVARLRKIVRVENNSTNQVIFFIRFLLKTIITLIQSLDNMCLNNKLQILIV